MIPNSSEFSLSEDTPKKFFSSLECYEKYAACFEKWKSDYETGAVTPRDAKEEHFWKLNLTVVPDQLRRGFLDYNKLPLRGVYEFAQSVAQSLYILNERLKLTAEVPRFRKITLRTYRDWQALLSQGMINLHRALRD